MHLAGQLVFGFWSIAFDFLQLIDRYLMCVLFVDISSTFSSTSVFIEICFFSRIDLYALVHLKNQISPSVKIFKKRLTRYFAFVT